MTSLGTIHSSYVFKILGELNAGRPSRGMTDGRRTKRGHKMNAGNYSEGEKKESNAVNKLGEEKNETYGG